MQMAEMLVRRALSSIRDHSFEWKSEKIKVEVSCGVAAVGELGQKDGTVELIEMADSRLYHSKRSYASCSTIGIEAEPFLAAV